VSFRTVDRCVRCRLRACLCDAIPRVETRTRFVIVRHVAERNKPSNTAHFATLALPRSELHEYGAREGELDQSRLAAANTWVLYPDGDRDPPTGVMPDRLIVLDGSWSQARRMRQRIGALRGLPFLRLPAPPKRLRLRRPIHPAGMSTLEAIAAAVELLEGRELAQPLERFHDLIVKVWLRESTRILSG
jgi:DTW domain-containing protein YfiP